MEVKIDPDKAKRIEEYVKAGSFPSVEEFVDQSLNLLLYAEDNKDMFKKLIKEREE